MEGGTVERPDTEILYYDLDNLSLTWKERIDGKTKLLGWDKSHQKVQWIRCKKMKKERCLLLREESLILSFLEEI